MHVVGGRCTRFCPIEQGDKIEVRTYDDGDEGGFGFLLTGIGEVFRDFIDYLSDREKIEGHWLTYQHGEYRFIVDRFLIHDILMILVINENAMDIKLEVYQYDIK